ncbi:serine hydrolase [Mycolicibacterium sp. BiH015]|uniref:serine hydrolase domain-containing protein n=1 Tax=Mycolicibacterium sp. BiH015 TaxID=3018808 RepID=UPI0022E6EE36|nr:serine hydrolase domain-containing protein [Mycolicibacterium sp. BiH015]MDA2892200.1 serine hydrolase [Mycolicibacterium sp. BiH015]
MTQLNGHAGPAFEPVVDLVAEKLRDGTETGVSLAVDIDGELVVDLWGGFRDVTRSQPWHRNSVTNVWSITKCVTSLAALLLVDSEELDIYSPVSRYWPAFGSHGKQAIEVRHLLSHTSGVSGLAQPATLEHLYDVRAAAARMAAQPPWWPPGTASGYHILNYGHLVGELMHRITGMSLREFVWQNISVPLDADFRIGMDAADIDRVADVITPAQNVDLTTLDRDSPAYKTFTGPSFDATVANTPAWRAADLGAANGHGNALSVLRVLAPISRAGHHDHGRLLSPHTIDLIFNEQSRGRDLVNGLHLRWGVGFALPDPHTLAWIPHGRIAFWGGWGGSMAIMDLDRHMTISYVMNNMGTDILGSLRAAAYIKAIYRAVDDREQ